MASDGATFAITLEDVTVESTHTEDEKRGSQAETGHERNKENKTRERTEDSAKKRAGPSTSVQLQKPNGPNAKDTLKPPPSPSRQHKRQHSRNGSGPKDNTPPLDQHSLLVAATLVLDAKSGRNLTFRTEEKYLRSYILYNQFYLCYGLYFFILLDLSLALFEKPALPGASLPYWGTMIIEVVCLAFFTMRVLHAMKFQDSKIFWRDTKNYLVIGTIVLTVIDMIGYVIWINISPDSHPVRWSRPLRVLFIINFSDGKQIRRAFRNIRRTVPDIMNVLVLFMMSVLLFGLLAFKLFYKRPNLVYATGEPYFKNYGDSVWDMYVLVTTANNPDVMMPAYNYNAWFAIFFVTYVVICLYIFMSIVLAAIYNNYKKNLKNEVKTAVYSKRQKLIKAFNILKVDINGRGAVTPNRWRQLMSVVMPKKSAAQVDLLNKVLDKSGDSYIYRSEFLNLSDLLQVKLTEVKDRQTLLEQFMPRIYKSRASEFVKMIVRHRFFRYAFDLLIFVNAFFIGFDVDAADWFFLTAFTLEIILKFYVFGPVQFFQRLWNVFDFFVIGGALVATLVEAIAGSSINDEFSTLDTLLVLRVLRLFKLFGSIKRFKIVIQTIINIGPSIITYGGVIFVFYYFFAIIGMEIFQGLIRYYGYSGNDTAIEHMFCGNIKLQNTTFYRLHYCKNNFDDILKAFVLLFELTVVNQWHVLTSGFVYVTNRAARIYFFAFHMCCVVIVLNIFTAFILEAFILEYSLQGAPKLESAVEAKIKQLGLGIGMKPKTMEPKTDEVGLVTEEQLPEEDTRPKEIQQAAAAAAQEEEYDSDSDTDSLPDLSAETGLRFHLKKRKRKKVEVLLQQMFQSEVDEDDLGPEDLNETTQITPATRKLTLDAVA